MPLLRQPQEKNRQKLVATKSGIRFVSSPDYEKAIDELVNRDFEPEAAFYQLLVGVTAYFLCGIDPHCEDLDIFDEFISENMTTIRAAIDRVKGSLPQIRYAEEAWIKSVLPLLADKDKDSNIEKSKRNA
jgi:hypothetical protein